MSISRQTYTMTAPEFESMGGVFATPAGYDPDATYVHERQGSLVLGKKTPRRDKYEEPDVKGVIAAKTLNPTDPNPGFTTVPFHVIVEVAKAHGVKPLSINWPDKYSPDFTGVPTDG